MVRSWRIKVLPAAHLGVAWSLAEDWPQGEPSGSHQKSVWKGDESRMRAVAASGPEVSQDVASASVAVGSRVGEGSGS